MHGFKNTWNKKLRATMFILLKYVQLDFCYDLINNHRK